MPFVSVRRSEDRLLPSSDCSWADEFNEPWSFVLRIFTTSSAELLASCPHPSYHECELGDLSPTFTTFRRPERLDLMRIDYHDRRFVATNRSKDLRTLFSHGL
jgi:hypothetical protein